MCNINHTWITHLKIYHKEFYYKYDKLVYIRILMV